jgi:hypothetical protein
MKCAENSRCFAEWAMPTRLTNEPKIGEPPTSPSKCTSPPGTAVATVLERALRSFRKLLGPPDACCAACSICASFEPTCPNQLGASSPHDAGAVDANAPMAPNPTPVIVIRAPISAGACDVSDSPNLPTLLIRGISLALSSSSCCFRSPPGLP